MRCQMMLVLWRRYTGRAGLPKRDLLALSRYIYGRNSLVRLVFMRFGSHGGRGRLSQVKKINAVTALHHVALHVAPVSL